MINELVKDRRKVWYLEWIWPWQGQNKHFRTKSLSVPLRFCPYPLFGVLTIHKNVFWKYIIMHGYLASSSSTQIDINLRDPNLQRAWLAWWAKQPGWTFCFLLWNYLATKLSQKHDKKTSVVSNHHQKTSLKRILLKCKLSFPVYWTLACQI